MTAQPVTASPTDTLNDVLYKLEKYQLSRLPVTEGTKLVEMITISDIIRAETDFLSSRATEKPTVRSDQ
jgi:CIC family chloride channel protein